MPFPDEVTGLEALAAQVSGLVQRRAPHMERLDAVAAGIHTQGGSALALEADIADVVAHIVTREADTK